MFTENAFRKAMKKIRKSLFMAIDSLKSTTIILLVKLIKLKLIIMTALHMVITTLNLSITIQKS
jgi:hypothetical protein